MAMLRIFCMVITLVQVQLIFSTGFSENFNHAVLRGSSLKIPCIPPEKTTTVFDLSKSSHWTTEDGSELSDPRFVKLKTGELQILDAHVVDSGKYTCKAKTTSTSGEETPKTESFTHKLVVYEISGHKYRSHITYNMADLSSEIVQNTLLEVLEKNVCGFNDLCESEKVKIENCDFSEIKTKMCEFSASYKAVTPYAVDPKCDEVCLRTSMMDKLNQAETKLQAELRLLGENPTAPMKANMETFKTHHLVTCSPGFHLVKSHNKRCFPCHPGTYSGPSSVKCHMCAVGKYQEHYGRHACDDCPDKKTTENVGSKSKASCIEADTGILSDMKKGFLSIFS